MRWQTEVTKIETDKDGAIVAKPPDGGAGWTPIGVHDGHVVWRAQLFEHADLECGHAKAALYGALLDVVVEEQSNAMASVVEERLGDALKRAAEAERAAAHYRSRLEAAGGFARMKSIIYQRGYCSGVRASKKPPHEDIVVTFRAVVEELEESRRCLEGIA